MNKTIKSSISIFSFFLIMLFSNYANAQLDIFKTPQNFTQKVDSIEISKPIELSNINNEIEYTDNLSLDCQMIKLKRIRV